VHSTPVAVAGNRRFRQISAGAFHTCALTPSTTNDIYCWGSGHLGNGSDAEEFRTPQLVSGAHAYRQVSAGDAFTCAVTTTYQVLCWGVNTRGQLGNGGSTAFVALTPVAVSGALEFLQVSAGQGHACAITTTAKAYCWGHGRWGQLGDGQTSSRFRPRAVVGGLSFSSLTAGAHHTCGQTPSHRAYCWGSSYNGQLGNGTTTLQPTPTAVKGALVFRQLEAGSYHTCGVDGAAQAWCWGSNFSGELGNGKLGRSFPSPWAIE
jgi:alpha-tubulin suppressor-like RCC1 family protein